jgi:RNA polymerase-binding transcription factor
VSAIDTEHFRTILVEERKRVRDAIDYLHAEHPGSLDEEVEEISAGSDNHLAETATATLDRELDYSLEENSEQVLNEIDGALRRMDEGTYGICASCGKEIAEERLEARPWASLCIDCARQAERR